jgi:hypothetical protein
MLIGVDFDNTIVYYDELFHRLALERGLIPRNLALGKDRVRNYLRACGREDDWTRLQGYVYGERVNEAPPFPGALDFFRRCRQVAVAVRIISHKTREPYRGPTCDLHQRARGWLAQHGFFERPIGLAPGDAYFETTKSCKLARIAESNCTHFIDDLPELLDEPAFPPGVERILFDPNNQHAAQNRFTRMVAWREIADALLGSAEVTR